MVRGNLASIKVLIIDPEPRRQRQLRTILNTLGHRAADIESAPDIEQGLQTLRSKRFDFCFLSVDCRNYEPLAKLGEIRSDLATKSVPVIAVGATLVLAA